jgi:hypothetical protein
LVWDSDIPGAQVAVEMCPGKTFTSVAATMKCTLVTVKVVMGSLQSIMWGHTLVDHEAVEQNYISGIIGREQEWYPLRRHNSVLHPFIDIKKTPLHRHPELSSAPEPILVVTMHGVAELLKSVIDTMTYATDFTVINFLHMENVNLTHKDLNTSLNKPGDTRNIHPVSYDTLTSRAKPSSNGQLSHCSCGFEIINKSNRYKKYNSVVW